jgi:DNA modification methylase
VSVRVLTGDCRTILPTLPAESVNCVVTSPPYFGLRDYGVAGQIGLEQTPDAYVAELVAVFREVRRVLKDDGVLFLNLGDSYFGGGQGGNPEDSPHQKQRTNRGSVSMPASARRADAYDKRGKAPEGSLASDCLCRNLCDACRAAYRLGKSHSDNRPAPTPSISNPASSREHTGSPSDHLPTSGLTPPDARSVAAIHDLPPSVGREHGQPLDALASTTIESSERFPVTRSAASSRDAGCQLCGRSLPDCVPVCADKTACTCGIGTPLDASGQSKSGKVSSGLAYPSLTTTTLKPKDLIGIPWRVAFALQADGWWLRQDIIWSKPNPMPESVTDRCTKAHEYLFLLSKSERYYYDAEAIKEDSITGDPRRPYTSEGAWELDGRPVEQRHGGKPRTAGNKSHKYVDAYEDSPTEEHWTKAGLMNVADVPWNSRNRRSVWTVATAPFAEAHFATFPPALIEPCIKAGCPEGGTVLDPFGGAGTTGLVADRLGRNAILIELNPTYADMSRERIRNDAPLFAQAPSP